MLAFITPVLRPSDAVPRAPGRPSVHRPVARRLVDMMSAVAGPEPRRADRSLLASTLLCGQHVDTSAALKDFWTRECESGHGPRRSCLATLVCEAGLGMLLPDAHGAYVPEEGEVMEHGGRHEDDEDGMAEVDLSQTWHEVLVELRGTLPILSLAVLLAKASTDCVELETAMRGARELMGDAELHMVPVPKALTVQEALATPVMGDLYWESVFDLIVNMNIEPGTDALRDTFLSNLSPTERARFRTVVTNHAYGPEHGHASCTVWTRVFMGMAAPWV